MDDTDRIAVSRLVRHMRLCGIALALLTTLCLYLLFCGSSASPATVRTESIIIENMAGASQNELLMATIMPAFYSIQRKGTTRAIFHSYRDNVALRLYGNDGTERFQVICSESDVGGTYLSVRNPISKTDVSLGADNNGAMLVVTSRDGKWIRFGFDKNNEPMIALANSSGENIKYVQWKDK